MGSLSHELCAAAADFAALTRVLVASDFDGVLAPLVLDPMTSRALPGTIEALEGLAALADTHVAVVSGRDLGTLTLLTGLADSAVTRIGSHGAERSGGATRDTALAAEQAGTLDDLVADLVAVAAEHPGAGLEHKPAAVVLHTRGMPDGAAREAEAAALEVATRHTGVQVLHGKHVVEMSVVHADKGTALVALRDEVSAEAVAYLGDDVTDEDAFRALSQADLTVKVGPGDTSARFRVRDPDEAAELLRLLLELRSSGAGPAVTG